MIDFQQVDKSFELGYEADLLVGFAVFDKRVLLSLSQAAQGICLASGEEITPEDLTRMGARGWIPLLSNVDDTETGIGIPIYGPSRVEFLLALERDGYSADELQTIAEEEEWWIDNFLTVDDLAYIDDDLETIVGHVEEFLQSLNSGRTYDASGRLVNRSEERVVCEQNLRLFYTYAKNEVRWPIVV